MLHAQETMKDAAAEFAEARRVWESAREVVLRDAVLAEALAGTNARAAQAPAAAPDRANSEAVASHADRADKTTVRPPHAARPRGEPVTFRSYGTAREAFVSALLKDAAAHEAGRFGEIGRRSDHIELPRVGPPGLAKLRVALTFWDAWIDARNRGWEPAGNITKVEWPALARLIASDIAEDREIPDALAARFDASADAS
ncbi:MAG: hypothetical protein ABR499_02390 [Gemmatimonadaceae bacterium]